MGGNLQFAADSFREMHEVNGAPEFIGYQLTDNTGAKARSGRWR